MKKLLFVLTLFSITTISSAQKMDFWLDAGLKVQYGFTSLYNANATSGDRWDNTLTTGAKYGVKLGMNWNYTGVSLDILSGKSKGQFQDLVTPAAGDREVTVQSTDLYLLFRNAKHKGYIEIGPKMSLINDVKTRSLTENISSNDTDLYESKNFGAVLGFGTYILGPEDGRFSGIFGLRFEYGFQDIVNADGRVEGDSRQPVNYTGEFASTNPIFAGIVFELNWGIGGVGQARCGERSKFIWF